MKLAGKKAIITGGTRGIGKAIAIAFAEQGADIAIFGTSEERGQEVVSALEAVKASSEQKFFFKKVDVSSNQEVKENIHHVLEIFENVDILVNCAGITRDKLLMKMEEEDWDAVLDINLKSVYNTTQILIRPMMKKRSGRIINITSVIGLMGNPGQVNYAASKAGMIGMTRSLAKEVASRNITVNCIAPGFIDTDMTNQLSDEQKEGILKQVPMGRLGNGKDIANAAVFLASSDGDYITGQVITIDGGMTA
ncbi:MAG: 3-oxoacyl-ACP reductase FabG [Chlamydiae bacterium]|nr:3-oxoacyl-ACP reductase FabG [Chlamydiota bacterium]